MADLFFKNIKFETIEKDVIKKQFGADYLSWGNNNAFPNYLIDLYKNTNKHGSIVKYKHLYVAGELDDSVKLAPVNGYGETIYDIFKLCALQYILFGGFVLLMKKIGTQKSYEVLSFHKCRIDAGFSTLYYGEFIDTTDLFQYKRARGGQYNVFPINDKKEDITALVCINDEFGRVYPSPEYASALNMIEIEYKVADFWNNFLSNNLSAGYLVKIFGYFGKTEEEKERKANEFIRTFSGNSKGGRVIVEFPRDRDSDISIENIDVPDFVDKYKTLNDAITQEIFIAHNITSPMLFGIRTEGQLGGRNELIDAYELFKQNYILPTRNNILSWLNAWTGGDFEQVVIKNKIPMNIDTTQLKGILTNDEIRQALGYEPLGQNNEQKSIETAQAKLLDIIDKKEGSNFFQILSTTDVDGKPTADGEFETLSQNIGLVRQSKVALSSISTLTKYDVEVLKLLNNNPQIELGTLSMFVGLSKRNINKLLSNLVEYGYLIENDGKYFVTAKGKQALANKDMIYTDIRYSYDWREGFSDADKKTSRDFCKKLMNKSRLKMASNKLWTRADIEEMSIEAGWDVWSMRGGWYRLPGTEISVPYCRHIWKQHIVFVSDEK